MNITNHANLPDAIVRAVVNDPYPHEKVGNIGVTRLIGPPQLWARDPPVRFRKSVPDRWLELTIREGRNRQVRRMTAAIGFPTLRLVRWRVGDWTLDGLAPGAWRDA